MAVAEDVALARRSSALRSRASCRPWSAAGLSMDGRGRVEEVRGRASGRSDGPTTGARSGEPRVIRSGRSRGERGRRRTSMLRRSHRLHRVTSASTGRRTTCASRAGRAVERDGDRATPRAPAAGRSSAARAAGRPTRLDHQVLLGGAHLAQIVVAREVDGDAERPHAGPLRARAARRRCRGCRTCGSSDRRRSRGPAGSRRSAGPGAVTGPRRRPSGSVAWRSAVPMRVEPRGSRPPIRLCTAGVRRSPNVLTG